MMGLVRVFLHFANRFFSSVGKYSYFNGFHRSRLLAGYKFVPVAAVLLIRNRDKWPIFLQYDVLFTLAIH